MANRSDADIGTNRTTLTKVIRSSAASNVISAVVPLLVLPRVLRGLDVSRYGEWATLLAVMTIGQLSEGGVGIEVARRVASAHGQGDSDGARRAVQEGTTILVAIAALLEVLGVAVARPVINLVFVTVSAGQRGQLTLLFIGVVTLLQVRLIGTGYFGILTGLQRADYGNWSGIVSVIVGAIVTVAALAVGLGLWTLLLAGYAQLLVSWVGPMFGIRRVVPDLRFGLVRVSPARALGFIGMPAMIVVASASDVFDSQIDKLVLTHTVGPSASAMFQIAAQVVVSATAVALIPLTVLLAGTAELYITNPVRLQRLEWLASRSAQTVAAVTAGGFLIFSSAFVTVWLGQGYGDAAMSLRFLAVASLLNMWAAPWFYYAVGRNRYHYVLIGAGVNLIVNATSTIFLTTRLGLIGALIGSVGGNAAGVLAGWLVLRRLERRQWLTPALRASAIVAVVVTPFWAMATHIPKSWIGLSAWAAAYLGACGIMLLVTRSLPMTFKLRRGISAHIAWREGPVKHL